MTTRIHTIIVATCVAATIAVGIASAAKYDAMTAVAPKADLLPVAGEGAADMNFVTVEERGDGVSILARMPADQAETETAVD